MTTPSPTRRPASRVLAGPLGLAALLLLTLSACSAGPDAKTAPEAESQAAQEASQEAAEPAPAPAPAGGTAGGGMPIEGFPEREPGSDQLPRSRSMAEAIQEVYLDTLREAVEEPESEQDDGLVIEYPEPPDGQWLEDDEGRRYFVREIPKSGRRYRIKGDQVRMQYGMIYDLVGETEEALLVKIYKAEPYERDPGYEPTPEEIAELEAQYSADLPVARDLTFVDFGQGLPPYGQWRNGFDIADMNGDGHADIVSGPPRRSFSGPAILLGDGAGSWRLWEEVTWPDLPYDYGDAEAADWNGDGVMDVAFAIHLSGIVAMVGDGQGGFTLWSEGLELQRPGLADKDTFITRTLTSADWDGDGLPDLLALSEGPRHPKATERRAVDSPLGVAVYPNRGDGTWGAPHRVAEDLQLFGDALAVGDLDRDGRPDAVAASNALGLREIVFLNGGSDDLDGLEVDALRPLSFVWAVAVADFDGDGVDDAVVSTSGWRALEWWGSLDVLLTRVGDDGRPTFERLPLIAGREVPPERIAAVGTGDLDGDGDADVVGLTEVGEVRIFTGDGRGGFTAQEAAPSEPEEGCRGYHVQLEDLDGEPGDEVVAAFAGERCPQGGRLRSWKFSAR